MKAKKLKDTSGGQVVEAKNIGDLFGPELIVKVRDPKIGLEGFLVVHNTALGLGKGGIRMTPDVTVEEVGRLAETMTWKNALAGIPFGGAKAGLVWKGGSDSMKKQHVQSFARALSPFIPKKYVAGPDVNSGEKEMAWIADALNNFQAATGKPRRYCKVVKGKKMCGLPHELGSTGFGVAHSTAVAAKFLGINIKGARVAIEGFGNVGTFAFKFLEEFGAKIVAVADSRGAIYDAKGLSYAGVIRTKSKTGSVANHKVGQALTRDDFWAVDCDILIPAGVTDSIHAGNKNVIRAKLIVEGANIPMNANIESEFGEKGIFVVPDFVANGGGVISSYAEYMGYSPAKMFDMVEAKVTTATKSVVRQALANNKNPRLAALEIAVARVEKAAKKRKSAF